MSAYYNALLVYQDNYHKLINMSSLTDEQQNDPGAMAKLGIDIQQQMMFITTLGSVMQKSNDVMSALQKMM